MPAATTAEQPQACETQAPAPEPQAAACVETPAPAASGAPEAAPEGLTIEEVKPGDLLKNLRDLQIYKVTEVAGRKIHARDMQAEDRTFLFLGQFERPAAEEAVEFEARRVKPAEPKESAVKPELAKKEQDALAACMSAVQQAPGSDASLFETFWKASLGVFGDEPAQTWRVRVNKGLQPSPTLRLRSSRTNRWRDSVMLWGQTKVTIIVAKEVCPEKDREACRALFPEDSEAYGKGLAVTIPYSDFDADKQAVYLDCFRTIVKAFSA
ncbi:MAG: hypothetical protein HY927_11635 [Elusimicrobia bacterium]|nr:hypothetical protein [Elusimicrobiota bacterium]